MTAVLFAVPFDCDNKGDVAVCNSIARSLKDVMPATTFTALVLARNGGFGASEECNVRSIPHIAQSPSAPIIGFCWAALRCVMWAVFYRVFGRRIDWLVKDELEVMEAYVNADLVLFPSRDIISVTYGVGPLLSDVLLGMVIALVLRKRTMVYAAQIGPLTKKLTEMWARFLTRSILDKVDLITVRDTASQRWLRALGVSRPPVYVAADPAFLLPSVTRAKAEYLLSCQGIEVSSQPLVGIGVSDLIWRFGFSETSEMEQKRREYLDAIVQLAECLVVQLGATVVLVPHVFNPGHNDLAVARQIHEEVGCKDKVRVLEGSKDPEELKGIIGLFDMFIAMRHHPLVHSVSQSVPTIGVDYTFKMREVMEAMNCGEWVLDMRTLTVGELVQKACALWYSRKYVQAQLESKVGEMKRRAMLSAELAKELASSAR